MLMVESDVGTPYDRSSQYTPQTSPFAPELGRAFAEVCRVDTPQSIRELRDATSNLVMRLKADGAPPERVIIVIKEALTRDGGSNRPPTFDYEEGAQNEPHATVYRRVFGWCLDTYFGESTTP